jgi:hypothetical protein
MEDIEKTKKQILENVIIAQPILDKIKVHPELENVQDSSLSAIGEGRWNKHFVLDTYHAVRAAYGAYSYNDIKDEANVPQKIKKFFLDATGYEFFNKN